MHQTANQQSSTGPRAAQAGSRPALRLTARGRRVLAALVFAPTALGVVAIATSAQPADAASTASSVVAETVTVRAGDTLWEIAEEHAEGRDVREVLHDLVVLNDLQGQSVEPGMQLVLPIG